MKRKRFLICIFFIGVAIIFFILFFINNSNSINDNKSNIDELDATKIVDSESESNTDEERENEESKDQTTEESESISSSSENVNKSYNDEADITQSTQTTDKTTTSQNNSNERQCVVKKFYSVFRADFDNFDECDKNGKELKEINNYYGYTCDYQTDDCGDIYYMLTFFDGNGNFIDYPSVPKS